MRAPGTANCLLGKKWNWLTDVLVVLSALIINRWGTRPIYQSEEKLIDTGFDFVAVTCCLRTSPSLFPVLLAGERVRCKNMLGNAPKQNKCLFRVLSHTQRRANSIGRWAAACPTSSKGQDTWSEDCEARRILPHMCLFSTPYAKPYVNGTLFRMGMLPW